MNKADSTSIHKMLTEKGLGECSSVEEASVIIINTCAVREHAENRVYSRLKYFRHIKEHHKPELKVVLTGCLARFSRERLENEFEVDLIADVYSQEELVEKIAANDYNSPAVSKTYHFKTPYADEKYPFKAFVSITHGCDNWCTYCIVPAVRGPMLSRPSSDILKSVKTLIEDGVKEITLLGQNVNSYGEDLEDEYDFTSLLDKINTVIEKANKRVWVRFMTSHPKDFSPRLAKAIVELPSLCEHLHLPMQSGSTAILEAMGRKYSREDYLQKVDYIRELRKDFALSTDVLVGFPGESEKDFEDTLSLVEEIGFEDAFLYRYSERKGSIASKKNLSYNDKEGLRRLSILIERQRKRGMECLKKALNTEMDALVESVAKDGENLLARSRENRMILIDKQLSSIGEFVKVKPSSLKGTTYFADSILSKL